MENNTTIQKYTAMIMPAMKAGKKVHAETYKMVKAKMMEYSTSKEGIKNLIRVNEETVRIPDNIEVTILNKMIKERNEAATTYETNGRPELAEAERAQAEIINELLPKAATVADVNNAIMKYVETNGDFDRKQMGAVIKFVKEQFVNVDGAMVSKQVMAYLNGPA